MPKSEQSVPHEPGGFIWKPRRAPLVFRSDEDPFKRRFSSLPTFIDGSSGWDESREDVRLYRRISEILTQNTENLMDSASEVFVQHLVNKMVGSVDSLPNSSILAEHSMRSIGSVEKLVEKADHAGYIAHAAEIGFFEVFADCKPGGQSFTPQTLAAECLEGINKSEQAKERIGGLFVNSHDFEAEIKELAEVFMRHISSSENVPDPDQVFRYRDRWFSLKPSAIVGVVVEALQPLVAFGKQTTGEDHVLFPVSDAEVYPENGEVVVGFLDGPAAGTDIHLHSSQPIKAVHAEQGYVAISTCGDLSLGEMPGVRSVKFGNDQLVVRTLPPLAT